eukprot:EG_transcript_10920
MGNQHSGADKSIFVLTARHEKLVSNDFLSIYKERNRFFISKPECWVVRNEDQHIILSIQNTQVDSLWPLVTRLTPMDILLDWNLEQLRCVFQLKVEQPAIPTAHLVTIVGSAVGLQRLTREELQQVHHQSRYTTMHVAAVHRSFLCLLHLLDEVPEQLLEVDSEGRTPLMAAVQTLNNQDCVSALLQHTLLTAPPDAPPAQQARAVQVRADATRAAHLAVEADSVQNAEVFVAALLENAQLLPEVPIAALVHTACRLGAMGCLRMMALRCPQHLLAPAPSGRSALQVAAEANQVACIALLLLHTPANHWLRTDPSGETVLHTATAAPECVRLVMDACSQHFGREMMRDFMNVVCDAGETALIRAVDQFELPTAAELLRAGAGAAARSRAGDTPLHRAVGLMSAAQAWEATRLLLSFPDAPLQALNTAGCSPAHCAIVLGRPPILQLLLEAGADPGHCTTEGDNACHLAVVHKQPQ